MLNWDKPKQIPHRSEVDVKMIVGMSHSQKLMQKTQIFIHCKSSVALSHSQKHT